MEKFLFKKVELWAVLFLVIACILFSVFMAWAVYDGISGKKRLGATGQKIVAIAKFPDTVQLVLSPTKSELFVSPYKVPENRFEGHSGFEFSYEPGSRPEAPFLVLDRVDWDVERGVTELVDLNSQTVKARVEWDVDPVWSSTGFKSHHLDLKVYHAAKRFKPVHSLLLGGDIITKTHGSLILKSDACNQISVFADRYLFHHSMEKDAKGNIWAAALLEEKTVSLGSNRYIDDAIAELTPDGEVIFIKSIAQILLENGLANFLYGQNVNVYAQDDDPIHLNDIEPVNSDSDYWKQGDVLLSLRHLSMVLLYRPSTNKVIWYTQGHTMHQHDVDIVGDGEISIFDNNEIVLAENEKYDGINRYMIYSLKDDTVRRAFTRGFEDQKIRTPTEGQTEQLPDGNLLVEETDFGRLMAMRPDGSIDWQFINRGADGNVYELGWSRTVSREEGEAFLKAREGVKCE